MAPRSIFQDDTHSNFAFRDRNIPPHRPTPTNPLRVDQNTPLTSLVMPDSAYGHCSGSIKRGDGPYQKTRVFVYKTWLDCNVIGARRTVQNSKGVGWSNSRSANSDTFEAVEVALHVIHPEPLIVYGLLEVARLNTLIFTHSSYVLHGKPPSYDLSVSASAEVRLTLGLRFCNPVHGCLRPP
jgi:hypothetical protein